VEIIAIVNKKGGVGKTTTALATAAGLAQRGFSVLAIDLDSQANFSLTAKSETDVIGAYEVLTGKENINEAIQERPEYDLIAADNNLTGADAAITETGKEYRLKEALQGLKKQYDYVIIDTPPNVGILTTNALAAANRIVITAQADTYSAAGLMQLSSSITVIKKYCNTLLKLDGVLLTRYNARTVLAAHLHNVFEKIAKEMETKVYKTVIRENVSLKEAQAEKQSIFEYAPTSNGSADYNNFLDELLGKD
jgi:chromosome partitioning protein